MKLYRFAHGIASRRVDIYLAEKGIDLPCVTVDPATREHKTSAFLAMNPAGLVPVLAFDDGGFLPEAAAIVEYLEELYPEPPMIGTSPKARARVRALDRIASIALVQAQAWLMHGHPHFTGRLTQEPAVSAAMKPVVEEALRVLEAHMGDDPFLAGPTPTIADCTLFPLVETGRVTLNEPIGAAFPRIDRWYARFAARPAARRAAA